MAAWACFFLVPIVFFPRPRSASFRYNEALIQMFICIDAYLIAFYYFNRQVLIPKLLTRRKWFWYILAIIGALIIILAIPKLFEEAIRAEMPESARGKMRRHKGSFYPFTGYTAVFFLVLTVSTCTKVIQEWLGAEKKKQEIETEKLATELSFLKSQINPHFLFNTLNNIYSLALIKSDKTADAVLKLSAIMRYVISETKRYTVPLDKEIEFVKHYIELQRVRLTDKVTIHFDIEGDTAMMEVPPLILIPFVENAFKYGISTKEPSIIHFDITVKGRTLSFFSQNHIFPVSLGSEENTGIGLKNTKRRLELLYPGRHELKAKPENNNFIVKLTLHS